MEHDIRYLKALSKSYPTIGAAANEIINLNALLHLPKGTEHFITDIHGEYNQFLHILKNGSGAIKKKIEEEFGPRIHAHEKKSLAALIYYPRQKLAEVKKEEEDLNEWYRITIYELVQVCRKAASKYTRSKVRKAMSAEFRYVIEELLNGQTDEIDQEAYYAEIIRSVIETSQADDLIVALADLIRRLVVDHLHVIGDIFDRGPYPHLVMDTLMTHHSVDIQWGNHDLEWMGAAAGCEALIATVIRNSVRYGNLDVLEDGYGINLVPLVRFALDVYDGHDCRSFKIHYDENECGERDAEMDEKVHKAITIIQFKLEGQLIKRHPEYKMEDRLLLGAVSPTEKTVTVDGKVYAMNDVDFPTVDWNDPYALTPAEEEVVARLKSAFQNSEKLQRHISFLYKKGSLYKVFNGNLLYHGCVPLNDDGTFKEVTIDGVKCSGRALYDRMEIYARKGYYAVDPVERQKGLDLLWFMWTHPDSPVFGKKKMATFERYFIDDRTTHAEPKNPYYRLYEDENVVKQILEEFGLRDDEDSHIVNGHVPVEAKSGESPIKCGGKLLVIDGGFSKAYQSKTGIAGYTLIFNSYGMILAAHEPFESIEKAVREGSDIHSHTEIVQRMIVRRMVSDTDAGKALKESVEDLTALLDAYRSGLIVEGTE